MTSDVLSEFTVGQVTFPLGAHCLSEGTPRVLREMAERYERLAAELTSTRRPSWWRSELN